jgi:UDP-GlcNAc:undecaprenyl-phosphate/decaprenyl-phosphate GlcNAc-1-phosphate transferase
MEHYILNINNTFIVMIGFIFAFILSWRFMPSLLRILKQRGFYESVDGRKIHNGEVPNLGGLIITSSVVISFSLLLGYFFEYITFAPLVAAIALMFLIGLKDDLEGMRYSHKLYFQIAAAFFVVWKGGLVIYDFGGLFYLNQIPSWIGWIFTLAVIVVITNAYNLIDGIDGLAGGLGGITSFFFGLWFLSVGYYPQALLAFCVVGALLGFLIYNWHPAKIFMGDTGSLIIGFIIAVLSVDFIRTGVTRADMPFGEAVPVIAMAAFAVPLYDTIRIFLLRTFIYGRPFAPCNGHIHHVLLRGTRSHRFVSIYLYLAQFFILSFAIIFSNILSVTWLYFAVLVHCFLVLPTFGLKRKLARQLPIVQLLRAGFSQNGRNGSRSRYRGNGAHRKKGRNGRNGSNGKRWEEYEEIIKQLVETR